MDTSTALISFDEAGVCNFCHEYDALAAKTVDRPREQRYAEFDALISAIKKAGAGAKYDCILGLSGGMDSSYMMLVAKEYGLRPLVVHFDNGWNSELAVENISNLISYTGFDLYTYVINWEDFKDIQLAYFKSSVIDIEVPTDQFIFASLFKIAHDQNIKYILSGNNIRTEGTLPSDWCYTRKLDLANLKDIHRKFGTRKNVKYPKLGISQRQKYRSYGIRTAAMFDKLDFDVEEVKRQLTEKANYKLYPCKHYESVFTRFYQGYILPRKFDVDKRKAHLSSVICSGQLSRAAALEELQHPPYLLEEQADDKEYVLKKWELSEREFDAIMQRPPVPHSAFATEKPRLANAVRERLGLIYKYKVKRLLPFLP